MAKKKAARKKTARTKPAQAKATKAKAKPAKAAPKKKRRGNTNSKSVRDQLDAIKHDREILQHYRQGKAPSDIAEIVGRDVRYVQKSIQRCRQQWREARIEDFADAAAAVEQTARYIMDLAFEAYTDSKQGDALDRHSVTNGTDGGSETVTREQKKPAAGDVKFLQLAQRCNYQIGQLYGLFDRDARDNSPTAEQTTALIEVVVTTPEQVAGVRHMDYKQLQQIAHQEVHGTVEAEAVRKK